MRTYGNLRAFVLAVIAGGGVPAAPAGDLDATMQAIPRDAPGPVVKPRSTALAATDADDGALPDDESVRGEGRFVGDEDNALATEPGMVERAVDSVNSTASSLLRTERK